MAGLLDDSAWGVDLTMSQDGDLQVGPSGDLQTTRGPDNLVQALRLRLMTVLGELPLHTGYGSRLNTDFIGRKNIASFAASTEMQAELAEILVEDPRFIRADVIRWEASTDTQLLEIQITAVDGSQMTISALPTPRLLEVSTPAFDDITTLPLSEIEQDGFFNDGTEADTLANSNFLAQLASDQSPDNSPVR